MRSLSNATATWASVFAAVHLYWALGGTIGNDPSADSLADSLYIGLIAAIGLASAGVALGFHQAWGARVGRRRLRLLARLGGALLGLGVVVGVGTWIAHASLDGDGASGVLITAYFLLGGVLFSALGWLADLGSAPVARPT